MDIVIIVFGYILAIILFCGLIKLRLKKAEKENRNYIYVLVVAIILLLIVWGVFRNFN